MRFLRDAGITLLVLAILAATVGYALTRAGLSARAQPPSVEVAVARRLRALALPAAAAALSNPLARDGGAWVEGGREFQDHCAVCHGDNGSGQSEIGRNLYPKAPDMRTRGTQICPTVPSSI